MRAAAAATATLAATLFALAAAVPALDDGPPRVPDELVPALPRYEIFASAVAVDGTSAWRVSAIAPRAFGWTVVAKEDPGRPPAGLLGVEEILERVAVCPGEKTTLARTLAEPFPSERLAFNRANGVIGEAYQSLYPGAPRLRRVSVPIYADLDRIKRAEGRYVDWPKSFVRLAPEEGSMLEYPDAPDGPERRWRAYTESDPGPLLQNFEYGLVLRERRMGPALVTTYRLSGPRTEWVRSFTGADVLTPLRAPNGYPAYLLTTVIDLDIEFSVGRPGDGSVLAFMEETLLALKARAEARSAE